MPRECACAENASSRELRTSYVTGEISDRLVRSRLLAPLFTPHSRRGGDSVPARAPRRDHLSVRGPPSCSCAFVTVPESPYKREAMHSGCLLSDHTLNQTPRASAAEKGSVDRRRTLSHRSHDQAADHTSRHRCWCAWFSLSPRAPAGEEDVDSESQSGYSWHALAEGIRRPVTHVPGHRGRTLGRGVPMADLLFRFRGSTQTRAREGQTHITLTVSRCDGMQNGSAYDPCVTAPRAYRPGTATHPQEEPSFLHRVTEG